MSLHALGIIVGGLIPAVCFTGSSLLNRLVVQTGISVGMILFFTGIGIVIISLPFLLMGPAAAFSARGAWLSMLIGMSWGLGVAGVTYAILKYKAALSVIVPIYNFNTLLVVLLSLVLFAEWQDVHVPRLIIGALLMVIGGTLVAMAKKIDN